MIKLISVIHDTPTNSVEATWVDEIRPAIEMPERTLPDTMGGDGVVIPGEVIPAHTIQPVQVQVKCHSYADVQMAMFRADVAQWGGDISKYEALIAEVEAGIVPYVAPIKTATQLQAEIVTATQARLDAFAQTRGYDGILSACTYAASTVPKFATEGKAAVIARDATWAALYTLMGAVMAGAQPMPAGFADVAPILPELVWPA